ncbi:hypothetical protein QQG55_19720 [Brugia pahangi]
MMLWYMTVVLKCLLLNVFLNVYFVSKQTSVSLKRPPVRQISEIDTTSKKYETLQSNDLHYIQMKISSTTLINDWSNGQSNWVNISTNSEQNFANRKSSSSSNYVNSFIETSSMTNFITNSNITEIITSKTESDIIESTSYNVTMESMKEKNISDIIIEEKIIKHLNDNKQTAKMLHYCGLY